MSNVIVCHGYTLHIDRAFFFSSILFLLLARFPLCSLLHYDVNVFIVCWNNCKRYFICISRESWKQMSEHKTIHSKQSSDESYAGMLKYFTTHTHCFLCGNLINQFRRLPHNFLTNIHNDLKSTREAWRRKFFSFPNASVWRLATKFLHVAGLQEFNIFFKTLGEGLYPEADADIEFSIKPEVFPFVILFYFELNKILLML